MDQQNNTNNNIRFQVLNITTQQSCKPSPALPLSIFTTPPTFYYTNPHHNGIKRISKYVEFQQDLPNEHFNINIFHDILY